VLRRRIDLAAIVLAVAVLANLLPDLIAHPPDSALWVLTWLKRFVIPTQSWEARIGIWGTDPIFNQSLGGTLGRIGASHLDLHTIKIVTYLLLLAMLITSLAIAASAKSPKAGSDSLPDNRPSQTAAEIGQIAALMLLASPNSSPAHFGILIVCAFVVARVARDSGSTLFWSILSIAGLLGLLNNKDLVGGTIYDLFLDAGILTWASVVLWAGCLLAIASGRVGAPAKPLARWLIQPNALTPAND